MQNIILIIAASFTFGFLEVKAQNMTQMNFGLDYPVKYSSRGMYRKAGFNWGFSRNIQLKNSWALNIGGELNFNLNTVNRAKNQTATITEVNGQYITTFIGSDGTVYEVYLVNNILQPYKNYDVNFSGTENFTQVAIELNIPILIGKGFFHDKMLISGGGIYSNYLTQHPSPLYFDNNAFNIPVKRQHLYWTLSYSYKLNKPTYLYVQYKSPMPFEKTYYGLIAMGIKFKI